MMMDIKRGGANFNFLFVAVSLLCLSLSLRIGNCNGNEVNADIDAVNEVNEEHAAVNEVSSFKPATPGLYPYLNFFKECDEWAERDGQCLENPKFMWGSCLNSCIHFSRDDNEMCAKWANEGECTANSNYIQFHCPQSCQYAIAWNPVLRRSINIDEVKWHKKIAKESCEIPNDLFAASEIMRERLEKFMSGAYNSVPSLSVSAPSEYLLMEGLSEGFLYVLNIYQALSLSEEKDGDGCRNALKQSDAFIEEIKQQLESTWSSDIIMRRLPEWQHHLQNIRYNIGQECKWEKKSETSPKECSYGTNPLTNLAPPEGFKIKTNPLNPPPGGVPVSKSSSFSDKAKLLNDRSMPLLGLGTWQIDGEACKLAVLEAIKIGYRSIDTAEAYRNEFDVGQGISEAIILGFIQSRDELFIATKMSDPSHAGYENTQSFVRSQLQVMGLEYFDLYMLHSPLGDSQRETWHALEDLVDEGLIRSLGVSNFNTRELKNLVESQVRKHKPVAVQNKLDIYHVGKQMDNEGDNLVGYAKSQGILVVAYSSFSAYPFVLKPIDDPVIRYIAANHPGFLTNDGEILPVTPAQVLLRWSMQKGAAVIPRSSNFERLLENYRACYGMAPLTEEEMNMIDALQHLVSSPVSKAISF